MFLTVEDLDQVIYGYQINQITEGRDDLVLQALAASEEETRSYIEPNTNRRESLDGRLLYDAEAIFTATGTDRNALILQHCVTIAKWHLVQLCNADIIYEQARERYDRAITWLRSLKNGDTTMKTLPMLTPSTEGEFIPKPFSYGSRKKFRHE